MTTRITIPDLCLVDARRRLRLGQVDVRRPPLRADRDRLVRLLPRLGRGRRERPVGNRRGVRGPAHDRREAARGGPAHRRRRHQRPPRRPPPARGAGPPPPRPPRRDRARRPAGGVPRTQRAAPRPGLRPPRRPQPAQRRSGARSGACTAKGSGACSSCAAATSRTRDVEREPRWTDRRTLTGPFDIIGDVHGCHEELVALLTALGWAVAADGTDARHPDGRTAVFLGDLVDRGPAHPGGAAARDEHGRRRRRDLHSGQPREQAEARARRPQRHDQPRPRGVPRPARRASRPSSGPASRPSSTGW